jgi:retron-type reverse transcriptase
MEGLGVPQGGILSPLLSNLVLHELDKFVMDLLQNREKNNKDARPSVRHPEYNKLTKQIMDVKLRREEEPKNRPPTPIYVSLTKTLKKLVKRRRQMPSVIPNPNFVKFDYIRYADDWLIGLTGPISFAKDLKERIRKFLETIKLELSSKKTLITSA